MDQTHFTQKELACPCCGRCEMDPVFMVTLELIRVAAGIPFIVNSGYRCPVHNKAVGSTSDNHPSGKAIDIRAVDGVTRWKIIAAAFDVGGVSIGVGKTYIHLDTNHPTPTLWTY